MTYSKDEAQSKIQRLGELMLSKRYDEAWTVASNLLAYFRAYGDVMPGSDYRVIDEVLRSFFSVNNQLDEVSMLAYGMGQKAVNTQL